MGTGLKTKASTQRACHR